MDSPLEAVREKNEVKEKEAKENACSQDTDEAGYENEHEHR